MATALRGKKHKSGKATPGICELRGLRSFAPHDLRRTAATLAGDLGFDDAWIAKCLDHAASRKGDVIVPTRFTFTAVGCRKSARCWTASQPSWDASSVSPCQLSKPVQKYVWLPDIKVDETGVEPFGRKPNGSTGLTQKRLSLSLHVNSLTIKRGETVLITLGIGAMWDGIFRALRAVFGERGLALLAVIGISAAVTWVVYVFFSESTRYSAQKYYDLKLSLSVEAAKTAAQIATSDNADVIHAAAIRFDELYWGKLVLVEDSALEGAMVDFRQKIARPDNELDIEKLVSKQIDRNKLRDLALKISQAGFNLLQPSWLDQLKSAFRTPQKGLAQSH